jgi:hypothetical protein
MQCKELEAVLEQEELGSLSHDAQEHLAGCSACQEMLAEISAIVDAAQHFPAEAEPPQRIWVSLRAQLEAEGIIHEPETVEVREHGRWGESLRHLLRPRVLATVGAVMFLVAGGAYLQQRRTGSAPAANPTPLQPQVKEVAKTVTPTPVETAPKAPHSNTPAASQTASVNVLSQTAEPRDSTKTLRPSPSEDARLGETAATMNQMEGAVTTRELADNEEVDASFRGNLRTLNAFIAECEARLKKNPKDRLTREYLNMAMQQKAELLTAMLDSGRSEN